LPTALASAVEEQDGLGRPESWRKASSTARIALRTIARLVLADIHRGVRFVLVAQTRPPPGARPHVSWTDIAAAPAGQADAPSRSLKITSLNGTSLIGEFSG
jgi:hypothetical protein